MQTVTTTTPSRPLPETRIAFARARIAPPILAGTLGLAIGALVNAGVNRRKTRGRAVLFSRRLGSATLGKSIGALATMATALGAAAFGAVAIGALGIGRLRIQLLDIDTLRVRREII